MMRVLLGITILALASLANGQTVDTASSFEVASVKPSVYLPGINNRGGLYGGPGSSSPGEITGSGVSMRALLMKAYAVRDFEIKNRPSWLESAIYDIAAKVPAGATREQFGQMLQGLLVERFRLASHWETKEGNVYVLILDKQGPAIMAVGTGSADQVGLNGIMADSHLGETYPQVKFKGKDGFPEIPPSVTRTMEVTFNRRTKMEIRHESMRQFAERLTAHLDRPVFDESGLQGEFDFSLAWVAGVVPAGQGAMSGGPDQASGVSEDIAGPSIFTAVRQLGLRLERSRGPIKSLVIDHLERTPQITNNSTWRSVH